MRRTGLMLLLAVAAVAGAAGARADVSGAGVCARCHEEEAALASLGDGHAPLLDCATCHEDRRPGSVGRGHRSIPTSCTSHHATAVETHPPSKRPLRRVQQQRRSCLACHDAHGSTNANLIRPAIRARHRLRPIAFPETDGDAAFVDPAAPGRGLCEVCHRTTTVYRADGRGEPHFTGDCTACHDHAAGFRPVVTEAGCPVCHAGEAERLGRGNLHGSKFAGRCTSCHAEASPEPGPGHRTSAACADCHAPDRVAAHVPPGMTIPCAQCHEPHGTDNVRLVRDVIHTSQGVDRPLRFARAGGREDGSFASASEPGTGICEVCHTSTQFYRADGSGAAHFETACLRCHTHGAGFFPR